MNSPSTIVLGSPKMRRRNATSRPRRLFGVLSARSALRSNFVFPLLRQPRPIRDRELAIILDEPDGRQRRHSLRRFNIVANRISVAELGLDGLCLLAEKEVDELLGTLGIGPALDDRSSADLSPRLGGEDHFYGLLRHESIDCIVLPSHAGDHLSARHQRNRRRTSRGI